MSTNRSSVGPEAAIRIFLDALSAHDEPVARCVSTEAGWGAGDLAVLYRQAIERAAPPGPVGGPRVHRGRACQEMAPATPTSARAWLLLERVGERWRVGGQTGAPAQVGLFLQGLAPAAWSLNALPDSPSALAWAQGVAAAINDGGSCPGELWDEPALGSAPPGGAATGAQVVVGPTVTVAAAGRAAAAFEFLREGADTGPVRWVLLDTTDDRMVPVKWTASMGLTALLDGVDVTWPGEVGPDLGPYGEAAPSLTAAEARKVVEAAISQATDRLAAAGDGELPEITKKVPDMLRQVFGAALAWDPSGSPGAQAPSEATASSPLAAADHPTAPADTPAAPPPAPAPGDVPAGLPTTENPGAAPQPPDDSKPNPAGPTAEDGPPRVRVENVVPGSVGDTIADYLAEQAADGHISGDEIDVDAHFIKAHGPAMVSSLIGGFMRAILPPELDDEEPATDDVPPADTDEQATSRPPRPVKLKVDMGKILAPLFQFPGVDGAPEPDSD